MVETQTTTIRDALATDAAAIARVRIAAWRFGYRGWVPDTYLDRSDFEELEVLHLHTALQTITDAVRISVAEREGQIVGYCAYGVYGDVNATPAHGGVYDVFVHPDTWRCGVGRTLLSYATTYLQSQGFSAAYLFVYEANARGRAFYHRLGWEPDGYRVIDERPEFTLPVLRYQKIFSR